MADPKGRDADSPADIPLRGWRSVGRRVIAEATSDTISLYAAGCAFYATLAIFPALSVLVSIYGLVFDPFAVEQQLDLVRPLLPPPAYDLVATRVHALVRAEATQLTLSLAVGGLLTLWSAASGTKAMLSALNLAYEERERRSFLRYQLTALGFTLAAGIGAALAISALVAVPAILGVFGLAGPESLFVRYASLGILMGFLVLNLTVLYRFGPCRATARWHWITPGALLATLLWAVASILFSFYVTRLASLDATYGPLGAVVALMLWFYVAVYAVLLGAELNAELEMQTAQDTTTGEALPMGSRGAYVADHVAE